MGYVIIVLKSLERGEVMARPRKRRRVCSMPNFKMFGPLNNSLDEKESIILTIDEYETIRLIDWEGLEQEQCAERMDVARSTIQRVYSEAKKKVADSIVNGKILRIEGGDYILCNMENKKCPSCGKGYHRHGRNKQF